MALSSSEINKRLYEKLYDYLSPNKQELFERYASERTNYITVVLENVYQEHNASAVVRSCDCLGIQNLHVVEQRNEYKVQTEIALGASNWVNIHNYSDPKNTTTNCLKALKKQGYKIVATTPHDNSQSIFEIDLSEPIAFVFGTEKEGISQEVLDEADETTFIPMYGFTESFNISVSVAIVLSAIRRRLEKSSIRWRLDENEQILAKIEWTKQLLNGGEYMCKRFTEDIINEATLQ